MPTSRISALTDQATLVGTDRLPVDAAAGTTRSILVSLLQPSLHHTTSAVDPTVTDDDTAGFVVGSVWVKEPGELAGALYVCSDPATGAAVWTLVAVANSGFTQDVSTGTSDNGTSLDYARADHVHGASLALADTTPNPVGEPAWGSATDASRADHVHGQSTRDRTVATDDTISNATDDVIRVSAQADLQLPDPAGKRFFVIKKTGSTAFTCNVLRYGTETIEGVAADLELPGSANLDFPAWGIYSDGTNWWVC